MLPIMAMSHASCEKNNEHYVANAIKFQDQNFSEALLEVQEITIYDETGRKFLYLMDVDANKDGAITVGEARNVYGLDLSGFSVTAPFMISDMSEIKYFTSLTTLYCGGNKLTTLDLSDNTNLIYLQCKRNQLTLLDVSKNTLLTHLDCSSSDLEYYKNQLTSLDLSNNAALEYLDCDYNQLTSLDLSNNTALTNLYCEGNQLTSLDLSNNTALESLSCSSNQLTSLDVHNNRELEHLYCRNNPLEKLILYAHHNIDYDDIESIESEYGDIIEYME